MKIKKLCHLKMDQRPQCQAMITRYSMCPKMRCSKPSAFNIGGYNFCKLHAGDFSLRYLLNGDKNENM